MKTVDLFAGGGGLSLGFSMAGYDVVAAFDNWQPAIELYEENFSHSIHKYDLSKAPSVAKIKNYKPDLIIGGPPCQDFSSAGKRDETLGRADLTMSFASIIENIKPKYFVMENVERAAKSNAMKLAIKKLKDCGYGLSARIINACYCGVPQNRKRMFVIGELNSHDGFLDAILESNLSPKQMSIRDYVGTEFQIEYYYRHPRSYKRRAIFSIDEPSPTIRGVNRPVPRGYPGHPGDAAPLSEHLRPLTTKERSIIQTYPREFKLTGSKTDIEQIIGNSVPVNLANYVANSLSQYYIQ